MQSCLRKSTNKSLVITSSITRPHKRRRRPTVPKGYERGTSFTGEVGTRDLSLAAHC